MDVSIEQKSPVYTLTVTEEELQHLYAGINGLSESSYTSCSVLCGGTYDYDMDWDLWHALKRALNGEES